MELLFSIVQFVLALVFLILLHEFGHFIVAKWMKIEVEEFGIGFPPRIKKLFQWRETEFTLNAIPLGGFVKPKGENDPSIPGGLAAANPWKRLAVLFAGPAMNLLLGAIIYMVIFYNLGIADQTQVVVAEVNPSSPAAQAGVLPGDQIVAINAQSIQGNNDVQSMVSANLEKPLQITVNRDGVEQTFTLVPRSNPPEGEGAIGIIMTNPTVKLSIAQAVPAGFKAIFMYAQALLELPVKMLQGRASSEETQVVGFVGMFGIFQEYRQGAPDAGISPLFGILFFIANITISLGLLNLVPFPALDGGRILFTLPEIIIRKRIPQKFENTVNLVGFGLLLLLLLYVNLKDIIVAIGGGNG
jgi:regulator of sigma E protease